MASRIPWDEETLVELAGQCSSQAQLAGLVAEKWKRRVSPSTLNAYLYRHPAVRGRVHAALSDGEEEVISRTDILEEENRELKLALTRQRRESVAEERVLRAVEAACQGIAPPKRRSPAPSRKAGGEVHHRQLLCLSDFHGGEVVDPAVIQNLNEYDFSIMLARIDELIESVLSHQRRSPQLTGLDIAFVGDMLSGANHQEIEVSNELVLAEQAVQMGTVMGQLVERLAAHYPSVRVFSVEGNHPRLNGKAMQAKNPQNNGDWIAAQFCKQYLANYPNVSMEVGRGSVQFEIAGRRVMCLHGDGIRSSMPGIPWGGVMRRVNQLQATLPNHIDHWIVGHFHQANLVNAGRVIMNGSLKGCDEWTLKALGAGDPPAQWLLTFDEKRSRMTDARLITPTAGVPA